MKRLLLLLFLAFLLAGCGDKALDVKGVQTNPDAYRKIVTVAGYVAAMSQNDPNVFGIIDLSDAKCSSDDCKKFLLPVRFDGKLPKTGETVLVTGAFDDKKGCFVAMKVRPLKL